MASTKFRKALGAVKDQTSISLAKVSNSSSLSDLDIAIVKATSHDEYPAEEKHIREILNLTCYSRNHISQCVCSLARRLSKTRSWTVALKTLVLVHRLLSEGDPTYEQEIFFATRRGTRMLNLSDFRDTSISGAWDFSAFVRTYARYLDEMLEYRMHGRRGKRRSRSQQMHEEVVMDEEMAAKVQSTPVREMRTERIFTKTQHLQQLLERFLACRPTGSAKNNRIVAMALYPLVKESYQLYFDLQEAMGIFVDRFMELDIPDCVRIHNIFTRLSKQFDDLDLFYSWCKSAGISRPSEFPSIDRVTQQKLDLMDDFIREKSNLGHHPKVKSFEQLTNEEDTMREAEEAADYEEESSQIQALRAPDEEVQEVVQEEAAVEESTMAIVKVEEEVDFLNLRDERMTVDDQTDKFALALFDGNTNAPAMPAWDAFSDDLADWETALVQSASNLSSQRAALGGGFDMLLLDGMYSQPRPEAALGSGSASSVVIPKAKPMLALPAPLSMGGGGEEDGGDPFAASLSVPAPAYVQMTDMEKKRRMLVEEQVMWQQYAKDGMQGQVSIAKLQQAQAGMHPMGGGYIQRF